MAKKAKKTSKRTGGVSLLRVQTNLGKAMAELKRIVKALEPGAQRRKLRSKIHKIAIVRVGLTGSSKKTSRKKSSKKAARKTSRKSSRRKSSHRKTSRKR